MSVGGVVVEIIDCGGADRLWVNTREPSSGDECAIFVERTPVTRSISEGDGLWWQGPYALWTPRSKGVAYACVDRRLKRIGCSGVSRPTITDMPRDSKEEPNANV